MRSILLHVHDDDCLEARLQAAMGLARRFDGHIECVQPIPIDFAAPGDVYGALAAEMIPVLRENAQELQRRIETRLEGEGVAWDWIAELVPAGDLILTHAALSDLVVLGACEPRGGRGASSLAGQVAIHAQTPVLVVPSTAQEIDRTAPVLVAWNGSIEASHALRAAVPLLKEASSVFLVTVEEAREGRGYDLPPTEGGRFLSRHGIECELVALPPLDGSAKDALRQAAQARKAGLVVMGAYGHSRLRELVLGGVTRGLLADPPVPLFLCH
ncbi:MAG TPA: universal stress protein [Sphingomonadaceae bacterium]|nr:universal stress protein [Sphingomonadaceae bacterium]